MKMHGVNVNMGHMKIVHNAMIHNTDVSLH